MFLEYIKDPKELSNFVNDNFSAIHRKKNKKYESFWQQIHGCKVSRWMNENDLIKTYLENYFIKNSTPGAIDVFAEYFKILSLEKIYNNVQLYKGKK